MVKRQDKVSKGYRIKLYSMEHGKIVSSSMENVRILRAIPMKENGKKVDLMAKVSRPGMMAVSMKESFSPENPLVREPSIRTMAKKLKAIGLQANFLKANQLRA